MSQEVLFVENKNGKKGILARGILDLRQNDSLPVIYDGDIGYSMSLGEDLKMLGRIKLEVDSGKCGNCDFFMDPESKCRRYMPGFVISLLVLKGKTRLPTRIYPHCQI